MKKNNRGLFIGIIILCAVIIIVIAAPILTPYSQGELTNDLLAHPFTKMHLLGTTNMGEDIWTMIVYGGRVSLVVGITAAFLSGVIGVLLGGIAGYFGGIIDKVFVEVTNMFLMIPSFFLILIVVALFGGSITNMMIIIALTSWPSNARMMRGQVMSLKERTFVQSASVMGESKLRILFCYIIPNGIFPVIANTTMNVAQAILTEASLSFLGLGDPNVASWGQMIMEGKPYLLNGWWIAASAGIAIMLVVIAFYLVGDGINAVVNPRLARRE